MSRFTRLLPAPFRQLSPTPWWFLPPAAVGVLILAATIALAPGIARETADPEPPRVTVRTLSAMTIEPKLDAFGTVRPRHTWQATAPVGGIVVSRHADLQPGAVFEAGTVLLDIDPADYHAEVARSEAAWLSARAALAEVEARGDELATALEIEQRALALAQREYERNVSLAAAGHVSSLQLDAEERTLLRQRQSVQNLATETRVLPARIRAATARVDETAAGVRRARANLARTAITMPFDGRIDTVSSDVGQYLAPGSPVLYATGLSDIEVEVEVPWDSFSARFPAALAAPADPNLSAIVRYRRNRDMLTWEGPVTRVDPGLTNRSHSIRVYVALPADPEQPVPAQNLFVDVTIVGPGLEDRVVVPRLVLEAGAVPVVDGASTLQLRPVTVEFETDAGLVIAEGLAAGDRVLLRRPHSLRPGEPVTPVEPSEPAR